MRRRGLLAAATVALALTSPAAGQPWQVGGAPPLPARLRLTNEQRGAWRAYRDELAQERAEAQGDRHDLERLNAMTTPERLDWTAAHAPQVEARVRRAAAATRAFYEALLPDQRRRFDEATREPLPPSPIRADEDAPPVLGAPPQGAEQRLPAPSETD